MPCDDITDVLELWFDENDRLEDYALTKRTCGAQVGHQAFLMPLLGNMEIETLADRITTSFYPTSTRSLTTKTS